MIRSRFGSIGIVILILLTCVPSVYGLNLTVQIKTTPDQAVLPFEIGFEATVTGGTAPYYFTWNFGDGLSSTLAKPNYVYRESGPYIVRVMVFDSQENFGVAHKTINIGAVTGSFDARNISYQVFTNTKNVRSLVQDRIDPDIVWIGTTGGLIRYNKAKGDYSYFIQELPSAFVTCMSQQSDGILWVGTVFGLARLDPGTNTVTRINTANSGLQDGIVNKLVQTADGKILVGNDFGLARFDPEANSWATIYAVNNDSVKPNYVFSLLQASDGKSWMGTYGNLARFDPATNAWTAFTMPDGDIPYNHVSALLQAADGKIWVGTGSGGLARFDPVTHSWTTIDTNNSGLPPNYAVSTLLQAADGKIWVGTYNGLVRFDPAANAWTTIHAANNLATPYYVNALLQASDGNIWIGKEYDGLERFDPATNVGTTIEITNSTIPENYISELRQASDGKIWVAIHGGLARFDPPTNAWTTIDIASSRPNNDFSTLLLAADGKIWVGTDYGLERFDPVTNTWTTFNAANSGLPVTWVSALLQTVDGKIWGGTDNGGLSCFDPSTNTWKIFKISTTGMTDNAILAADGKIWVGTYNGGLVRFDPATSALITFNSANTGLQIDLVDALLQDTEGTIWVGTVRDGLFRFDPVTNAWTTFNTANSGLPNNAVAALLQAADGAIWVATYGGLTRFDPATNTWTTFSTANSSLPYNLVTALLQASDGTIWVGTMGGLARMTFQNSSPSNGRLVLVAGGGAARSNTLWPTTKELAETTYRIFNNRRFVNTDIYFISPDKRADVNGDGIDDRVVDCPPSNEDRNPTVADLRYAITDWAVKNYTQGSPLYVYLIDHGWPDDGHHGPYFEVAPGQLLYAKDLNEMLNTYEKATGGQVIIINESCYSGQFLPPLMKSGRIVFTATADKLANYDNWGANSFTNFFLQKLFENDSLQQAYVKASNTLAQRALTKDQRPQLDDNSDGKSNQADGIVAASIKLGSDFTTGASWPQILTIANGGLSDNTCSFTVKTNVHMRKVWATVQPPNYLPDSSGSYQKIQLETFDLTDPNATLTYTGTYQKFTIPGTYLVTVYIRDQFGNAAVSDPIRIDVGMAGKGAISGSVNLQMDDYQVSAGSAGIVARVMETDASTLIDASGNFSLYGVPAGTYTVRISGPLFNPVTISDVTVTAGQAATLATPVVVKIAGSGTTTTPGDATGDNKLGMDDVIFILQTLSGQRE